MSLILEICLLLFAIILIVPVGFFILELLLSLPRSRAKTIKTDALPRTAILVPAHNEERTIARALEKMRSTMPENCKILVVADNCSDDTAKIAEQAGVEVVVRHSDEEKGKGFALAYGIRHLSADAPEIVIIIDADCHVEDGAIRKLSLLAHQSGQPVQSNYLMEPHKNGSLMQRVSAFAFLINCYHRMLGLARMGLPVRLNGTGMAFPWKVIKTVDLGNDNIVEDIKLGVDLVKAGSPALFCPQALVTSKFPQSTKALQTQRTRWEHGHLELLRTVAPGLILHSLKNRYWAALGFALDLAIPPLTLALYLLIVGFIASAIASLFGLSTLPLILFTVTGTLFTISLGLVWWRDGRDILPPRALGSLPVYLLSKIKIYAGYIFNREKSWIRTDRS